MSNVLCFWMLPVGSIGRQTLWIILNNRNYRCNYFPLLPHRRCHIELYWIWNILWIDLAIFPEPGFLLKIFFKTAKKGYCWLWFFSECQKEFHQLKISEKIYEYSQYLLIVTTGAIIFYGSPAAYYIIEWVPKQKLPMVK